ncbi:NAD(P)-dependent oxidoreductase, partial [Mangrovactinospora gilvigrisea]|uniref:NAD(P)-dependent oxidoreductase n=1 Tax=Mangrovactinospora gilvigrisea TaxID=1428644 RepID=UPI000B035AEC
AAERLGAAPVDLDTLARRSQVVSLHAPDLPETRQLLDRRRLALLPDGALVVNTARGALIDTAALAEEAASGRLDAVLDVTDPEPLPPGHPLFDLPNVLLTPHLAGALGNEVPRLGEAALAELHRYAAGQALDHEVRPEDWDRIA